MLNLLKNIILNISKVYMHKKESIICNPLFRVNHFQQMQPWHHKCWQLTINIKKWKWIYLLLWIFRKSKESHIWILFLGVFTIDSTTPFAFPIFLFSIHWIHCEEIEIKTTTNTSSTSSSTVNQLCGQLI